MDLGEANNFNGIEEGVNHWLIKTMFNYLDEIIEFHNSKNITNVEYGCGTCNNIYHLLKRSKYSSIIKSIIGIEPNLNNQQKPNWASDANCSLDSSLSSSYHADIVIAMDVLEHIQNNYSALKEWKHTLKPTGLLLIFVPAFQHLWSSHDIFLGHYKRYNKKDLNVRAKSMELRTVKIHYIISYIYPAIYLLRKSFLDNFKKMVI